MYPDNLLLACYEMGHQPLSLAWPLAKLRQAGCQVEGIDLSVETFPDKMIECASFVGISVPMHTAMRIGVQAAHRIRTLNPNAHICFYGSYAWLNADYLLASSKAGGHSIADSIIAGESEDALVQLVTGLNGGQSSRDLPGVMTLKTTSRPSMGRLSFPVPDRSTLPGLENYALFAENGHRIRTGYVEATRGCLHKCLHCPIVPIYDGKLVVVPAEVVLADIRQQVAAGAGHINFGDPDFLNGPGHALKIVRAMHDEFPRVTFNFTTKVEHIMEKRHLLPELRHLGAAFMISAFESTSDLVLDQMQKGHTVTDLDSVLEIASSARLPIQSTWVPFTPWSSLDDYLFFLAWIESRGLVGNIPAIQLSIRLLVPPGSALATSSDTSGWLGELDGANFTYRWLHPDRRVDLLQTEVARIAEEFSESSPDAFDAIKRAAYGLAGLEVPVSGHHKTISPVPPRLTEDWFC